jgi:hypothetical protein
VTAHGDSYIHRDRLAWGFWCRECLTAAVARHAHFTPRPEEPCRFWLFLDANTGEMLEALYQR